jgi:hypothetical protein
MAQAQVSLASAEIPSIDLTRPNQVISQDVGNFGKSKLSLIHGALLAFATTLLYPCGAVAVRGAGVAAFKKPDRLYPDTYFAPPCAA